MIWINSKSQEPRKDKVSHFGKPRRWRRRLRLRKKSVIRTWRQFKTVCGHEIGHIIIQGAKHQIEPERPPPPSPPPPSVARTTAMRPLAPLHTNICPTSALCAAASNFFVRPTTIWHRINTRIHTTETRAHTFAYIFISLVLNEHHSIIETRFWRGEHSASFIRSGRLRFCI